LRLYEGKKMRLQEFQQRCLDVLASGTPILNDCRYFKGGNVVNHNFVDVVIFDRADFLPKGSRVEPLPKYAESEGIIRSEELIRIWYHDGWRFRLWPKNKEINPYPLPNDHKAIYSRIYDVEDSTKWTFGKEAVIIQMRDLGLEKHIHLIERW
jgi:hypothetical protein